MPKPSLLLLAFATAAATPYAVGASPSALSASPSALSASPSAVGASPFAASASGQERRDSADVRVRNLYFVQDYATASSEGLRLIKATPNDPSLRAWTVLALSRNGMQPRAIAMADSMAKRQPKSMWSHFARAVALAYAPAEQEKDPEALAEAEKARAAGPSDEYAYWVHAYVLANQSRYRQELAMLDSAASRGITSILLSNMAASAMMNSATEAGHPPDTARITRGLAMFERTRSEAPDNFEAHYVPGSWLVARRRAEEGRALVEKAVAISPASLAAHATLWAAIQARRDWTEEQKAAAILPDVDQLLAVNRTNPVVLQRLRGQYQVLKAYDRMHEVESLILDNFPDSEQGAWVHIERYRALSDSLSKKLVPDTTGVSARLTKMQWDFVDRPTKVTTGLADTYLSLVFKIRSDTTVPAAKLLQAVKGVAKYNDYNPGTSHSIGPIALAERGVHLKDAEAITREGVLNAQKYMQKNKSFYRGDGEWLNASNSLQAIQRDALGWVLYRQGRKAEAIKELNRALEYHKESTAAMYHLGRIAEADGDFATAEQHYAKGRGFETAGEKLNTRALTALYVKRHGSMDGYEAYATALDEKDRDRRWSNIVAARIKEPRQMLAFNLEDVNGKRVSSADLNGKFLVVNLWGVWCGPCVAESPELQKLHDRLKDDPDVVFLTIANDANPQTTRDFMKQRKFTFPALLDDGFVAKVNNTTFPTTWFVDRDGKIVYSHVGASDVVVEEFLWRIDLLRGATQRRTSIQ